MKKRKTEEFLLSGRMNTITTNTIMMNTVMMNTIMMNTIMMMIPITRMMTFQVHAVPKRRTALSTSGENCAVLLTQEYRY